MKNQRELASSILDQAWLRGVGEALDLVVAELASAPPGDRRRRTAAAQLGGLQRRVLGLARVELVAHYCAGVDLTAHSARAVMLRAFGVAVSMSDLVERFATSGRTAHERTEFDASAVTEPVLDEMRAVLELVQDGWKTQVESALERARQAHERTGQD